MRSVPRDPQTFSALPARAEPWENWDITNRDTITNRDRTNRDVTTIVTDRDITNNRDIRKITGKGRKQQLNGDNNKLAGITNRDTTNIGIKSIVLTIGIKLID